MSVVAIVDTGSSFTIVHPADARRAGLKTFEAETLETARAEMVPGRLAVATLVIGRRSRLPETTVFIPDEPLSVDRVRDPETGRLRSVRAIVGVDTLQELGLLVDPRHHRLRRPIR